MRMTGHKTEAVYRRYAITDSAMLQAGPVKLKTLSCGRFGKQSKLNSLSAKD